MSKFNLGLVCMLKSVHLKCCAVEDALLSKLTVEVNGALIQFKLAPTYILYLTLRSRASRMTRPDVPANEHARRITGLSNKMARLIQQAIGVCIINV